MYTKNCKKHSGRGMTVSFSSGRIKVLDIEHAFKEKWIRLELKSDDRCFMSWDWFSSFCSTLPKDHVFGYSELIDKDDNTIGLLLFGETKRKRLKIFTASALLAFRTGIDAYDQVWAEYTKPLVERGVRALDVQNWLAYIVTTFSADELTFKVAALDVFWERLLSEALTFERKEGGGYVLFSKKTNLANKYTRRQLNQTAAYFKDRNGLRLIEINECDDKIGVLEKYSHWHIEKWEETTTPSGFLNPSFMSFHQNLLAHACRVLPRIFVVKCENEVLGFSYILQDKRWAGFYLCSIKDFRSNHVHLGTWLHINIAQVLSTEGVEEYDFMAGDNPYKKRLSNGDRDYGEIKVRRLNAMHYAEKKLLELRNC